MPYDSNPNLSHVRMDAVRMVRLGFSTRTVARHFGFSQSVIVKWMRRAPDDRRLRLIPTRSSRPLSHPHALSPEIIHAILAMREERNQCAEILFHRLSEQGVPVSLSSIKRILKRYGCSRYSRWKKWHQYPPRPVPESPGILVEVDTIHDGPHERRLYVYTLMDVCSRWASALPVEKISTHQSIRFVREIEAPFSLKTLQSDHGPEFSKYFTTQIEAAGISHRHSRVRTPNDNAHLERFNRTIQDECLARMNRSLAAYQKEIPEYLHYYNTERPHMGLNMQTPLEILKRFQAID